MKTTVLFFLSAPLLTAALPIALRAASLSEASLPYNAPSTAIFTSDIPRFLEGQRVALYIASDAQPLLDPHILSPPHNDAADPVSGLPSAPTSTPPSRIAQSEKNPIPTTELMRESARLLQFAPNLKNPPPPESVGPPTQHRHGRAGPCHASSRHAHRRQHEHGLVNIIVPAPVVLFVMAVVLVEAVEACWQRYKARRIGAIRLAGAEAQLRAEQCEGESESGVQGQQSEKSNDFVVTVKEAEED